MRKLVSLVGIWIASAASFAHETTTSVQSVKEVAWTAPKIARVLTAGYPDSLGLYAFIGRRTPLVHKIDGKSCVTANFLSFDVADTFAHDIDEDVTLNLIFHGPSTGAVFYSYDRNGVAEPVGRLEEPAKNEEWHSVEISLDRARFVGRGMAGTDIALAAEGTYVPGLEDAATTFTLCGLSIERHRVSNPDDGAFGALSLTILDDGKPTSAKVGIYDEMGRSVLPNEQAMSIEFYDKATRQFTVRWSIPPRSFWPHTNRYVFYTGGNYSQDVPAGRYTVVVSKGPEYRFSVHHVEVDGGHTTNLSAQLERYIDMPSQGWMSGDVHIHLARNEASNDKLLSFLSAEDVHLSNLLQMSSFGGQHFRQYAFGEEGRFSHGRHSIVSGTEGPRTGQRGHTIALNISEAFHRPSAYFLYHRFFEAYQSQGGLTGYAHVGSEEFLASRGIALDAPFGHVDFVEIMQNSRLRPELWYELLNLGFRVAPAAGSDFPYFDYPGSVRSYVQVPKSGGPTDWFTGLKSGKTFITNGPLVNLTIADQSIGGELSAAQVAEKPSIAVQANMNPDLGRLRQLQIIHCGDVIEDVSLSGDADLEFSFPSVDDGWFAVRVSGDNDTQAHSGAIYIAGPHGNMCGAKVQQVARRMIDRLDLMSAHVVDPNRELEYWEVGGMKIAYALQRPELLSRIKLAKKFYQSLLGK